MCCASLCKFHDWTVGCFTQILHRVLFSHIWFKTTKQIRLSRLPVLTLITWTALSQPWKPKPSICTFVSCLALFYLYLPPPPPFFCSFLFFTCEIEDSLFSHWWAPMGCPSNVQGQRFYRWYGAGEELEPACASWKDVSVTALSTDCKTNDERNTSSRRSRVKALDGQSGSGSQVCEKHNLRGKMCVGFRKMVCAAQHQSPVLERPPCIKCMSLFCCFLLRVEMYASVLTWRRPNSKKHDCWEEWGLLVKLRWSLFLSSHACYAMKGIKDLCPTNKMSFNTKRSTGYKKLQREVHLLIIILVLL